jgi:hypothetical protein
MRTVKTITAVCLAVSLGMSTSTLSREGIAGRTTVSAIPSANPAYCLAEHNVGKLVMSVNNNGTFGINYAMLGAFDCFTGLAARPCEYPKGSHTTYMYGAALWIGSIIGHDTLVSVGADGWQNPVNEMHPDEAPMGNTIYRSRLDPTAPEYVGAVSDQDYIAVFTDTFTMGVPGLEQPDYLDERLHIPLRVEITCASYAWSRAELEDFVIFDYTLRNIGSHRLTRMYIGLYVDADVSVTPQLGQPGSFDDDVAGFREKAPASDLPPSCPPDSDLINIAYIADNDGDFGRPAPWAPVPNVTGMCFLRTPAESSNVSFNWWVSDGNDPVRDFGPQTIRMQRDFGTGGSGTPEGDRNKYYVMSNHELDYDQVYTASIEPADTIWVPPPASIAENLATGWDARYLLSIGQFSLEPGDSVKFTIAYVGGENLHTIPSNIDNLPDNPDAYMANLDFSDLTTNVLWAQRVFDVPGFDTDGDGYAGGFVWCNGDTVWRTGDGVPDFAGDFPLPAPVVRVTPLQEALKVQWNGYAAQTFREPLARTLSFEGFNVYLSANGMPSGLAMVASFDVEDFHKYVWSVGLHDWRIDKQRFMLSDLLCRYAPQGCNDAYWHPLQFPRQTPFIWSINPDSVFYFEQIGTNACRFGIETPILRSYPDAPRPPYQSPGEVPSDSTDFYLTENGDFKFYEYELTISNLLGDQEYLVTVTAFDYGSFVQGSLPRESDPNLNAVAATPLGDCCDDPTLGNLDNSADGWVTLADLTVLIDHLYISLMPLDCPKAGNLDLSTDGLVTMGDLTAMIDHLFISLSPLPPCP